jgi:hypothetical protein
MQKSDRLIIILALSAILGVFLTGALISYRHAAAKQRAYETVDELENRRIEYTTSLERNPYIPAKTPLTSDFGLITQTGYPVEAVLIDPKIGLFSITLHMVPRQVCKQILIDYNNIPLQMETGTTSLGTGTKFTGDTSICDADKNAMLFAYSPYADEMYKAVDK